MKGVPPFADFALRLNQALDDEGFAPKGEGRQNDLAKRMKGKGHRMTPRGVRKWLEGQSMPRMPKLQALALITKREVGWLVGGSASDRVAEAPPSYSTLSPNALALARAYDKMPKEVQWLALSIVQMLATLSNQKHASYMQRLEQAAKLRGSLGELPL